jgi:predicted dehydrogenase
MNAISVVAIIGAGQLGSRHLQSLSKTDYLLYVVDPSEESLKLAKERFDEVADEFRGSISYLNRIDDLPAEIDVCIVATNSKVRAQVTESLLLHSRIRFLILEKVLFPVLKEYDHIQQLLKNSSTKAWVNCPRRMFPIFNHIKTNLW